MTRRSLTLAACLFISSSAMAQEAQQGQPAPAEPQLPDVEVIQQKQAPAAAKPKPPAAQAKPKPVVQQESIEPVAPPEALEEPAPVLENSPYGAAGSTGAQQRAYQSAQTPSNGTSIVPQNLDGFAEAGTNVTPADLKERQPRNINEVFTQVPGMIVINDDASGHHGGLAVRGSPARRSRKLLVMEDGQSVNLALWLDPSVHYYAPLDRVESVEVLRGTVITHGPNNNFGVINIRNLSPFGPDETVVSSAIGFTKSKTGSFVNEDDEVVTGGNDTDISAKWHVHTRQSSGNVGAVFAYTGENVQGAWDNERLRFNDFYGALGWKGIDQDLTVSVVHARQRDNYDEMNVIGDDDDPPGTAEAIFDGIKHCKSCFAPGSSLDTYDGDIWRSQIVHNAYLDKDTTITTRLYGTHHTRDRYQVITPESNPLDADDDNIGISPIADEDDGEILLGPDTMIARLRTFRHLGGEVRSEFANLPLVSGMSHDIQAGIRYEYQDMTNRNVLGDNGEVLDGDNQAGLTFFDRALKANTVSAFLQTSIHATSDLKVVPGVRFEWYDIKRRSRVVAEEEGEAEEAEGSDCDDLGLEVDPGEEAECLEIEGINFDPSVPRDSTSSFNVLPGISFAYTGFYRTTIFGGYNRGMSTGVLRNEDFPVADEIGDNFEIGLRSTALRGLAFEAVGFHQRIQDYQFGASFATDAADRVFGRADKVEINGVELAGRLNSQPFTGGPMNFYGAANYTYARGIFKKGTKTSVNDNGTEDDESDDFEETVSFAGNHLPEVPFHVAALTLGIENYSGWRWDASVTYTYRGAFFTDEDNSPFGSDPEGENGEVPDVWLLSARFNLDIGNSGASLFVAGDNLTDELYITDREDGVKPGIGRTIWTGFKYRF